MSSMPLSGPCGRGCSGPALSAAAIDTLLVRVRRRPVDEPRRRRTSDPRAPAPAPPPPGRPGGRLPDQEPRRGAAAQEDSAQALPTLRRRRGLGLAPGRRHRHHEHHARLGDRADARDRHPHGRRRPRPRHPLAVPDRGDDAVAASAAPSASSSASSEPGCSRHLAGWPWIISLRALLLAVGFSCHGRDRASASIRPAMQPIWIRSRPCVTNRMWPRSRR